MRSVGQKRLTGSDEDPRVAELRMAVSRLRRELAGLRTEFPDRPIAEDELAALPLDWGWPVLIVGTLVPS